MPLLEEYKGLDLHRWNYYEADAPENEKNAVLREFNNNNATAFITKIFKCGGKENAFDISFFKDYLKNGKHSHTVSLYFLGCLLSEIVDTHLEAYLSRYVDSLRKDGWYCFNYTWFLTCLYHDTASAIEKSEWHRDCPSDIDFYLGKEDVQYNVFEHAWSNPLMKPYTYSESLVRNYFKYRVEYCHAIDHGIIGGYLLYDRLVKNYDKNWAEYKKEHPDAPDACYNDFIHGGEYNNLRWRKAHMDHFAVIADAIIAHNIWHSKNATENKNLYRQYGLDPLIHGKAKKTNIKEAPLLFFLGLLDTLEPVKRFDNPVDCLNHIDIWGQDTFIYITVPAKYANTTWFNGLSDIENWLAVHVDPDGNANNIMRKNKNKNKITIYIIRDND